MTVKCPDCRRSNSISKENGKIKCKKCLQYIVIQDCKAICCIPKAIFE